MRIVKFGLYHNNASQPFILNCLNEFDCLKFSQGRFCRLKIVSELAGRGAVCWIDLSFNSYSTTNTIFIFNMYKFFLDIFLLFIIFELNGDNDINKYHAV